MADSASEKSVDFLEPSAPTGKDILKQIDKGVYKQILIFLGLSLLIALGFYIYLRIGQESVVRKNVQKSQAQTATQSSDKHNQTQARFTQDQQRKNDVVTINSALKAFFLDNENTPETLDELVPDFLPELLLDPQTKKEYIYTPGPDQKNWKISATLSDGTLFEVTGP
ncbi:MAG TPA: hypothetical protein VF303_01225 [Candidatus Nanoarchaeia archaeon]